MKTWHSHAVILSLATVLCVACAPTPVVPSGAARIPINSEEGISHYRERVKVEQRDRVERNGLVRQIDALTKEIQELKSYVTLLQLQQQESEKGPVRQVGTGNPLLLGRALGKASAKEKQAPGAKAVPPIAAVSDDVAVPPSIPMPEGPMDLCGQKIGDANAYGWVEPTSKSLAHRAGLGAEHGLCRHISNATSAGQ